MKLEKIHSKYKEIMRVDDQEKRDYKLNKLLIEMEQFFNIPTHPDWTWEKQNLALLAIYRKISLSRWRVTTG